MPTSGWYLDDVGISCYSSSRNWYYYTSSGSNHNLGNGETCSFTVPSSASGAASLCIGSGNVGSGDDRLSLNHSEGWVTGVTPAIIFQGFAGKQGAYAGRIPMAKRV